MNWYSRDERRYVEYGSSFSAARRFGIAQQLTDTVFNMNAEHLPADVPTVFESLDDAGVRTAGTTYLIYRGRHEHQVSRATALTRLAATVMRRPVMGPSELFYADIFASRETPAAARSSGCRACATSTPAASARYLVEHDLFDFLLLSLPDNDTHSHRTARTRRSRRSPTADRQIERMLHAGGGVDAFLDEHAVIVVADHSHAAGRAAHRLRRRRSPSSHVLAAERRAPTTPRSRCARRSAARWSTCCVPEGRDALVPRLVDARRWRSRASTSSCGGPRRARARIARRARRAALRAGRRPRATCAAGAGRSTATLGGARRARRDGVLRSAELPGRAGARVGGADLPDLRRRAALSAAPGWEFADWGGVDHVGGGSHGSLHRSRLARRAGLLRGRPGRTDHGAVDRSPTSRRWSRAHFGVVTGCARRRSSRRCSPALRCRAAARDRAPRSVAVALCPPQRRRQRARRPGAPESRLDVAAARPPADRPNQAIGDRRPRRRSHRASARKLPRLVPERLPEGRRALAGRLLRARQAAEGDRPGLRRRRHRQGHRGLDRLKVAWTMARGYPGAFGRKVNSPWVWIPLTILFVAPFVDARRPLRCCHLDLLVLPPSASRSRSSTTPRSACRCRSSIRCSLYLLAAHAVDRPAPRRPRAPGRCALQGPGDVAGGRRSSSCSASAIGLNVTNSNVIDVGYAGVIGADRLAHGERAVRRRSRRTTQHGDTYGPVELRRLRPVRAGAGRGAGSWDDLPAAHGAAVVFDLLCLRAAVPDRPARARADLGIVLAYAWAAYPVHALRDEHATPTTRSSPRWCSPRCSRPPAPARRGLFVALAGMAKFAPLGAGAAAGDAPRRAACGASLLAVRRGPSLALRRRWSLPTARTRARSSTARSASRRQRGSPFSIWGLRGWTRAQHVVQVCAVVARGGGRVRARAGATSSGSPRSARAMLIGAAARRRRTGSTSTSSWFFPLVMSRLRRPCLGSGSSTCSIDAARRGCAAQRMTHAHEPRVVLGGLEAHATCACAATRSPAPCARRSRRRAGRSCRRR